MKKGFIFFLNFIFISTFALAQQTASTIEPPRTADVSYNPGIENPAYPNGKGPVVIIDESHNNFHTAVGTYWSFALVLKKDGYTVKRGTTKITPELLQSCRIYVIADAQPPMKKGDPPTFSREEIETLNSWVRNGGSVFIITDHMPDPGAISELAGSFGIRVNNGYVLNTFFSGRETPIVFKRFDNTLAENAITNGRTPSEKVSQVASFAGSAFRAGKAFQAVLVFGKGKRSWMPEQYWKFPPGTPNISVEGWFQGGVMEYGKGRIAFFSEAAMFTAQVFNQGKIKAGMNNALARDNAQLLLNVMHWLSGLF